MGVLRIAAALSLALSCSLTGSLARAEETQETEQSGVESSDTAAAARAFQDGQKAQLSGDHARAAELFELADELSPTPQALRSAIRNRAAAGHPARAATLALAAKERYPHDTNTLAAANEVLAQVAPSLARLTIHCDAPCALLIDGQALTVEAVASADTFVPPGQRVVEARFGTEQRSTETVELLAGDARELEMHAPALPEIEAPPAPATTAAPTPSQPVAVDVRPRGARAGDDRGLPPWLFLTASALTVTGAAAAIVSGVDALDKRDAYEAEPTYAGYERGVDSERRTNALLLATAGLAVTSVVLLALTDWRSTGRTSDEGRSERAATTLSWSPFAPNLVLRSSLP